MHRILIIDPEPSIRKALEIGLSSEDFKIDIAKNGMEGIQLGCQGDPDIVIVALTLPDLDGYEVINRIQCFRPEIIVIAITERTIEEELFEAAKHGVSRYLEKPLDMKSVQDAIAFGLEEQALQRIYHRV